MTATIAHPDPASVLPRFVESVRVGTSVRGRAHRVDRLPDGRMALVFRVVEAGRRGDLTLIGPRTRALLKDATDFARAVTLELKPGWSTPLLGVAASELTDAFVLLEDVWGPPARHLCQQLVATPRVTDVVDRIVRALAARLDETHERTSAWLARHAARLLEGGEARVDLVADRLGVTPRHLRRAFVENIGVGPKEFARSVRLQRALHLARTSADWARIAIDAGYYDQAHLSADFRDLIGLTPREYMRRVREREPPMPELYSPSL